MRLGKFEHVEPKSLSEACAVLAECGDRARVVAGGTDILVRMKQRTVEPQVLVNIKQVEGLGDIKSEGGDLRIGSAAALTDVQKSAAVREYAPVLVEAAAAVGATQLQNMGTLGGNLCLDTRCWFYNQTHAWRQGRAVCLKVGGDVCHMAKGSDRCYALYSGDTAPALLALGAKVKVVSSRGERVLPLEDFFVDDGKSPTVLQSDELLAEVIIPKLEDRGALINQGSTYLKFRRREAIDFPIVGVGATIVEDKGVCRQVRVAVTGAGSAPFVVKDVQRILVGKKLSQALVVEAAETAFKQAKPVSHMEVSAAYRKRLVRVLVGDALSQLAGLVP